MSFCPAQAQEELTIRDRDPDTHLAPTSLTAFTTVTRLPAHRRKVSTAHNPRRRLVLVALCAPLGPLPEVVDEELEAVEGWLVERDVHEWNLRLECGGEQRERWWERGFAGCGGERGE